MMSGFVDSNATHAQTHDRLQAIVASAMDAIITIDDHHRIICFNPAAELMFKLSATEALGQKLERFIPDRYRASHDAHITRFGQTGETSRRMGMLGAVSALRSDGEEFPAEASISQALAGNERLSTVIMRDITEREASAKAQALLAREVDHRAKNILAIVSSLVALTPAPTREAYMASLQGRIEAMSRAHGLLSLARWRGASLGRVVSDELEAHAESHQFSCDGPNIMLGPNAVQPIGMLFHELVTNAVKYGALSVPGGHVAVDWSAQRHGGISLSWVERGGPPVNAPGEAGFGSMLIQQIIENQLGGRVVSSWKEAGHELHMHLPEQLLQLDPELDAPVNQDAAATARQKDPDDAVMPDPNVGGGSLLIVEDEPLLAMQLSRSLQDYGWTVMGVAGSIEDANRILSTQSRPDAAILDVDLGGAPVFPLARALRHAGIPFLFCTGYEDLDYSREFGTCKTLRKPATTIQIVRALRSVIQAGTMTLGQA